MGEEESERHREEEEVGGKKDMELTELSGAKPLKSSATQQLQRGWQAAERERNPKSPHLKKHSLWCFPPCSLHTKIQSEPPLCMVLKLDYEVANAFSAADKRSGFSSLEKVCEYFSRRRRLGRLLICGETRTSPQMKSLLQLSTAA